MNIQDIDQIEELSSSQLKGRHGGSGGIGALIQVTQMKARTGEAALGDASNQQDLVAAQKARDSGKHPISTKLSKSPWGIF